MAASRKSLEKIKELEEKRRHDPDAKREWDRLIVEFDQESFKPTPPDPKGRELTALIDNLAEVLDKRGKHGSDDSDDCGGCNERYDGQDGGDNLLDRIDLNNLAELVFERLIFEVRIERQRAGQSA